MDEIIRRHAVVRWRENLDDFLFELKEREGISLSLAQMDAIIEAVIRVAIHRTADV